MRRIGYLAVDHGPRATLEALASRLPGEWLEQGGEEAGTWIGALRARRIELLICGTSDTAVGRKTEASARTAARELGVAAVVIEDFPGNYCGVRADRPQLLFVESEFAATLARQNAEGASLPIQVCPCVHYDALRRNLDKLRTAPQAKQQNAVLWVGQPDTRDSLETLKRLLPALAAHRAALWFRAHPRDEGYGRGAYQSLLNATGLVVEDLTSSALADVLTRRPTLVATQFSSVAIEAGFWGICGLNVLFPDVGGRTLTAKKGYAVPPWCEDGAAFLIVHQADVGKVLDRALTSTQARAQAMQSFDRYFMVHEEGSQRLINVLYNHGFL